MSIPAPDPRARSRSLLTGAPWLALLLVLSLLATTPGAIANPNEDEDALSSGLRDAMVVSDGEHVYVLGGLKENGPTRDILKIDADTLEVTKVGNLPSARFAASAAYLSGKIYVFGGAQETGGAVTASSSIMEFDPGSGDARTLPTASLPNGVFSSAAAAHGNKAYIFGGFRTDSLERSDRIIEFNPSATLSKVTTLDARLPQPLMDATASHDGTKIVIAGGLSGSSGSSSVEDDVLFFRPLSKQIETAPFKLEQAVRKSGSVAHDGSVYVISGGLDNALSSGTPQIQKIDEDGTGTLNLTIDAPRWRTGAALVDDHVLLVGGSTADSEYLRSVTKIDLDAPVPGQTDPEEDEGGEDTPQDDGPAEEDEQGSTDDPDTDPGNESDGAEPSDNNLSEDSDEGEDDQDLVDQEQDQAPGPEAIPAPPAALFLILLAAISLIERSRRRK